MHAVVMESLEEYLSGLLEPAAHRRIETHLNDCASCRAGIEGMADVSRRFGALRNQECEPAPGFYARVVERIETTSAAPSFAGLFAFDLVFARRLAFSCMLTLAVLGSFLVSREIAYRGSFTPDTVLAQDSTAASGSALAQDNMLLALTAYER
ncbi:MAG: anti-sigma factor [Bryobacteraceae bacterium]